MWTELRLGIFSISILGFICICPLMLESIHSVVFHYFMIYMRKLCNVNVYVHGNKELLKENHMYMSNHYEGVDYIVLYSVVTQPLSRPCYVIGKDDLLGRQYPIKTLGSVVDFIVRLFYDSGYIIPYTRGDKESGVRVRKKAIEVLQNNSLLLFPEGRSWRKGACHEFKAGMFEVAEEYKHSIVPITLKYRNFDGKNKGEKCILADWLDIDVDVYIHDKVDYKDHKLMLQETFEKITSKN